MTVIWTGACSSCKSEFMMRSIACEPAFSKEFETQCMNCHHKVRMIAVDPVLHVQEGL